MSTNQRANPQSAWLAALNAKPAQKFTRPMTGDSFNFPDPAIGYAPGHNSVRPIHPKQGEIMPTGKFEIKKVKTGYLFNLLANNGNVILTSEIYNDKKGAKNGVASVQKNAGNDARYELRESKNKQPYFVLLAANKQVIGKSQMYKSKKSCKSGMESVKNHAAEARILDLAE